MAHSMQDDSADQSQWQTHKGWETHRIDSYARHNMPFTWIIAITMILIGIPILFVLREELAKENHAILLGLAFPLLGSFLLYRAIVLTLEQRRFGQVCFEMDPYPGAIGGHIGGQIHIPALSHDRAASASQLFVRLECVHSMLSGGENRSRNEHIEWAEQGAPQIEHAPQGVCLLFRFTVPQHLPAADISREGNYYFWRVTVNAVFSGIDLYRQFDIPAFKSDTQSRTTHHDLSAQFAAKHTQASDAARMAISMGDFDVPGLSKAMHLENQHDTINMTFSIFRNKLIAIYAAIFAGGFGFASYSLLNMLGAGTSYDIFIMLFTLPFLLVALIATGMTIYLSFNSLHVKIDRQHISTTRRLFYIPIFFQNLSRTDLSHLSLKKYGSTGQGVDKIEHYKLFAHHQSGKKMTIAENIDGEETAHHFCEYLAQRLNVESIT